MFKKIIHVISYPMVWVMAVFYRMSNPSSRTNFLSMMDAAWTERWREILGGNNED